jgi:hypothetical protein
MANQCDVTLKIQGDPEAAKDFWAHLAHLNNLTQENVGLGTFTESSDGISEDTMEAFLKKYPLRITDPWFDADILEESSKVCFWTKWTITEEDFDGLSKAYPNVVFRVSFSEPGEDFGGYRKYLNGNEIEKEDGPASFSIEVLTESLMYTLAAASLPMEKVMLMYHAIPDGEDKTEHTESGIYIPNSYLHRAFEWVLNGGKISASMPEEELDKALADLLIKSGIPTRTIEWEEEEEDIYTDGTEECLQIWKNALHDEKGYPKLTQKFLADVLGEQEEEEV